ncbi:hypothetical protein D9M72_428230 [compost metagenome]
MVQRGVVEPGRNLEVLFGVIQDRRVGERSGRIQRGEGVRSGVVAVVEQLAGGSLVRLCVLGNVGLAGAFLVADHVSGVVGDDVEVDLHPARVGLVDQRLQFGVGAQVRVDLGEVGDPVPVVTGRFVLRLDRFVLEAGRQPDGRGAQALDVVDLVQQALEVAAVVEALLGRVVAGDHRIGAQSAVVVRGASVAETVRHHEIEVLVRHRGAERVGGRRRARAFRLRRRLGGGCQSGCGNQRCNHRGEAPAYLVAGWILGVRTAEKHDKETFRKATLLL